MSSLSSLLPPEQVDRSLSRILHAGFVCLSRARRPSVIILMSAFGWLHGNCQREGPTTDARRTRGIRRPSNAWLPSIRHEINIARTSSHRRHVVIVVFVAVFASSSHASSAVVALSSHHCRIAVASSPCRRRSVVVLSSSWPLRPLF